MGVSAEMLVTKKPTKALNSDAHKLGPVSAGVGYKLSRVNETGFSKFGTSEGKRENSFLASCDKTNDAP